MKYFLIAGEASGDLHGSNLIKEIKKKDPNATIYCYGGDLMQKEGGILLKHYKKMAYMGFLSVLLHLPQILKNVIDCLCELSHRTPDCLILIDYSGFNLRIAKYAKKKFHLPVFYYIAPKVWAWNEGRIKSLREYVDKIFCILPFEEEYFNQRGCRATYVGNPVVDAVEQYKTGNTPNLHDFIKEHEFNENGSIVAILCGSRKTEIKANLPMMLKATEHLNYYKRIIAIAPGIEKEFYSSFVQDRNVYLLKGETYRLLQHSAIAIVTSGTATLETALFNVPQVCCYAVKGGKLVYKFYEWILKVKYISLVNLILDKPAIKELISCLFTTESLKREVNRLLFKPAYTDEMKANYTLLKEKLGEKGASEQVAQGIVETLFSIKGGK